MKPRTLMTSITPHSPDVRLPAGRVCSSLCADPSGCCACSRAEPSTHTPDSCLLSLLGLSVRVPFLVLSCPVATWVHGCCTLSARVQLAAPVLTLVPRRCTCVRLGPCLCSADQDPTVLFMSSLYIQYCSLLRLLRPAT